MKFYKKFSFFIILLCLASFINIKSQEIEVCDGCANKCGTFSNSDFKEKLQRSFYWDSLGNPKDGQKSVISPKGIFKINYDTTGFNAPSLIDKNQNGIPDYVDSVAFYFDYVYNIYINELGFRSPYPDSNGRGSNYYDVYLWDLGNSDSDTSKDYQEGGFYGLTSSTSYDAIAGEPFKTTYSFIMIDNDFAATDSIRVKGKLKNFPAYKYPGIPSLKVTIAHEFFHAIQFMYGESMPARSTVMEMNAVAMERYFFPEVKDYLQYVNALFKNTASYPFGFDDQNTGYAFSIFNQYMIEKFGIEIMRIIWENVASGNEVYSAIDLALKNFGSDLRHAWCEFIDWTYYTGERTIEGQYFSNAKELPLLIPFSNINFEPPSKSVSSYMSPLEFRFIRFVFPGDEIRTNINYDILLGNTDINSASKQFDIRRDYFLQVADKSIPNSIKIDGLNYWKHFEYDSSFLCVNTFTGGPLNIGYPYPSPFRKSKDEYLYIPAPKSSEVDEKVFLVIYDSEMHEVFSNTIKVSINNEKKVVVWAQIPDDLNSGTYIFGVHKNDDVIIGKFAFIKD